LTNDVVPQKGFSKTTVE